MEFKIYSVYLFCDGCNLNSGYTLKIQLVMKLHRATFFKSKLSGKKSRKTPLKNYFFVKYILKIDKLQIRVYYYTC